MYELLLFWGRILFLLRMLPVARLQLCRDEDMLMISCGKIEKMITPYLDKLRQSSRSAEQKNALNLIELNLRAIVSPFLYSQLSLIIKLTAKEIQISNLIKQGMSTKEIASALEISTRTVVTHRHQIRKKIGLKGKKSNLRKELLKTY